MVCRRFFCTLTSGLLLRERTPGQTCSAAAARQARQASRIALITLALYFVTMASQVVTAWNSKRTNERRWHMTVPLLLGSAGLMCALTLQRCLLCSRL